MKSVRIATVPDQGAAEVARDALGEAGIPAELEKRENDNPYLRNTLVPWSLWVPADRVKEAEGILKGLALELEGQAEIAAVSAQALDSADAVEDLAPPDAKPAPTLSGVLLTMVAPLPLSCFYARVPLLGAVFMAGFVSTVATLAGYEKGQAPREILLGLALLKVLDGVVAAIALFPRRQAASERKT